jgi:hypothetical protein
MFGRSAGGRRSDLPSIKLYGAFRKTIAQVYAEHLESLGTKAYSVSQAGRIFKTSGLRPKFIRAELSSGNLPTGMPDGDIKA